MSQQLNNFAWTDPAYKEIAPLPPALDCWYLTGPTASGKTVVGLELAERLGAEIISLDSMAIYRGMNIGTAKPTDADRQRVPHHLLDLRDPTADFSVSDYVTLAHAAIQDIRERGKQVLFVGGTPLYLKAMLRGVYQGPPADWEFRRQVEAEAAAVGVDRLHARLAQVDPLTAARLHTHDQRRIIRALEVYKLTGKPLSHQQTQFEDGTPANQCRVFVLSWSRSLLHRRIEQRVERMFAMGLVVEVQGLLEKWVTLSRTAWQAVGYREVLEFLAHQRSYEATVDRVTVRTRQFARRQETWFRSLIECRRIPRREDDTPAQVAEAVLKAAED